MISIAILGQLFSVLRCVVKLDKALEFRYIYWVLPGLFTAMRTLSCSYPPPYLLNQPSDLSLIAKDMHLHPLIASAMAAGTVYAETKYTTAVPGSASELFKLEPDNFKLPIPPSLPTEVLSLFMNPAAANPVAATGATARRQDKNNDVGYLETRGSKPKPTTTILILPSTVLTEIVVQTATASAPSTALVSNVHLMGKEATASKHISVEIDPEPTKATVKSKAAPPAVTVYAKADSSADSASASASIVQEPTGEANPVVHRYERLRDSYYHREHSVRCENEKDAKDGQPGGRQHHCQEVDEKHENAADEELLTRHAKFVREKPNEALLLAKLTIKIIKDRKGWTAKQKHANPIEELQEVQELRKNNKKIVDKTLRFADKSPEKAVRFAKLTIETLPKVSDKSNN